uniref:gliding motility-associated C-terminal domain-containing protein n=1 Tax=Corallibacter sp. TaxID=2038084 RepID=UPI003AB292FD
TRTWTFTDACNNASSVSQTITIQDTTAPVAPQAPADVTYECIADVPAAVELTATDNCSGDIVATATDVTDDADPCNVTMTRTWTFTDACNNASSVSQTITIQDTTAPVVTNDLSDIFVTCSEVPEAPTLVLDECSIGEPEVNFTETSSFDGSNNDYEIIWSWDITDSCGNSTTVEQHVFVSILNSTSEVNTEKCSNDGLVDLFDYYDGTDLNGTWEVISGDATLDDGIFDPSLVDLGDYTFSYTSAEGNCLNTVEVNINVNDDCIVLPAPQPCSRESIIISNAVTPNGDQWNEFFEIKGGETCGFVKEIKIFNRWGAMIYESKNYTNNWNGTAHKSSVGNSDKVPNGTYYYIINLKNSGFEPITGYFYVGTK